MPLPFLENPAPFPYPSRFENPNCFFDFLFAKKKKIDYIKRFLAKLPADGPEIRNPEEKP